MPFGRTWPLCWAEIGTRGSCSFRSMRWTGHADVGAEFGGGFGADPADQSGEVEQRGVIGPGSVHRLKAVHDFLIRGSILFVHEPGDVGFDDGAGDGIGAAVGAIWDLAKDSDEG